MQQIRDIMTRNVEVIHPDAPIREAARKMRDSNAGAIPVCDGRRIMGMITDRDVVIRVLAQDRDPRTVRVSEIMSPKVVYCHDDQNIGNAARLMQKNHVRRIVVVDRNKDLVGILSLSDLALESGKERLAGRTLGAIRGMSQGGMSRFPLLRSNPVLFGGILFGLGSYFLSRRPEMIRDYFPMLRTRRWREMEMNRPTEHGRGFYDNPSSDLRTVA